MRHVTRDLSLGVIIGNCDFLPDQLVAETRAEVLAVLKAAGVTPVLISPEETKLGGIVTHADARRWADLFRRHHDQIDGVLVVLPNFGDEKGVADTLKLFGLNVPITARLCDGAFDALMAGDAATHDAKVAAALEELAAEVDVILLAQASRARVVGTLPGSPARPPILASPPLAIDWLAERVAGGVDTVKEALCQTC